MFTIIQQGIYANLKEKRVKKIKLKIFSFFSGSGFLDLGFEQNGYSIDFVNEISSSFLNAYKYSRKKMKLPVPQFGYHNIDINEFLDARSGELSSYINEARKDDCLIGFIGGPPCPDFSIAGKQQGRNGLNGKLSLSYIRLIINQLPDFFLFENVKGLWRTAKHREYYDELKTMLYEAGYCMADRLTNAIEFGAPQDRDRVLLFGIKKELFLNNETDLFLVFPWNKYITHPFSEIAMIDWPTVSPFEENSITDCPEQVPRELTVQHWFEINDVNNHSNSKDVFKPRAGLVKMLTVEEGDDSKKSYKRLHRWRYSPTVAYGNNEVHLHPYKARRLTVAEALALQSLPKEFSLPADMSLTDKFKTVGNGVPFMLSSAIARTISDFLLNEVS